MAKAVIYGGLDLRASRCLLPSSGDSLLWHLPLLGDFNYGEFRNKYPPIYKCVDFEEIYGYLCSWMAQLKNLYNSRVDGTAPESAEASGILPFSEQDFRIMLRQALLSTCETSYLTQFIMPRQFNSSSDNGFVPFLQGCNCYGDATFQGLLVPQIFQENWSSLQARSYRPPVKFQKEKNVIRYLPVLGRFVNDVPADFLFNQIGSDIQVNLFASISQTTIELTDCSISASNLVCANNSYYQTVMNDWNFHVTELAQYSSKIIALGTDRGAQGLSLLSATRLQNKMSEVSGKKLQGQREIQCMKYVANGPGGMKKKISVKEMKANVKEDKNVKALPVATLTTLVTSTMTLAQPLTSPQISLYDYLILPVNRTDPISGSDPISSAMLQTESLEGFSINFPTKTVLGQVAGRSSYLRLWNAAGLCAPGTAGATNAVYNDIMSELAMHGQAGMLTDLIGGVVSSAFPATKGVVDLVRSVSPF